LEQAKDVEQAHNAYLVERLAHVKSDEYVERWAREHGMAKPGEIAVIVLPSADEEPVAPDARPEATPTPDTRSFPIKLWELAFGPARTP
jgi:hypothetical protein